MTIVRTVLGDVAPERLGFTLTHEHLFGQPPAEVAEDDLCLASEADAVKAMQAYKTVGGNALVEMTTPDYGRDVCALKRISEASGVHILAATGFNQAKFADRHSEGLSEEALTEWMVAEVTEGVQEPPPFICKGSSPTLIQAGVIKGSSSLGGPTRAEEKVLRAVARAHLRTGAPVSTHTEKATWALEQASFLLEHGVKPEKLLIGHLDFRPDPSYLAEIASLGVYLGLDQFSKVKYLADAERVKLVVSLFEQGFGDQLLLSGDLARKSYWQTSGGLGFRHLPATIRSCLHDAGLSKADTEGLFYKNPRNWLNFSP